MIELTPEQKGFAPWLLSQRGECCVLTGHAGTGKTTILKGLIDTWPGSIMWCAPTHSASDNLADKIGCPVITIHAALSMTPKVVDGKYGFFPGISTRIEGEKPSLLVIDESSMLDDDMIRWILQAQKTRGALFCGDPEQLPPVGCNHSPAFFLNCPKYELTKVFRQGKNSPILSLATDTRNGRGNTASLYGIKTIDIEDEEAIEKFFMGSYEGIALAYTNEEVAYINNIARKVMNKGIMPDKKFIAGEKIRLHGPVGGINGPKNGDIVTIYNTPELTIFLGFPVWEITITDDIGKCYRINIPKDEKISKQITKRKKYLESSYKNASNEEKRKINTEVEMIENKIVMVSHPYAMTIHKAQGLNLDHVLFCYRGLGKSDDEIFRRKLAYTAITRAAKTITLAG